MRSLGWSATAVLLLLSGCKTPDFAAMRQEQTTAFTQQLKERTEATIKDRGTLDLDACIDIALENNTALKSAEIQQRLATLDRQTAFSNFLPTLDLKFNLTALDHQPASKMFGALTVPMQDQTVRDMTFQLQQPVFVPATWYLFSMRQRGEEIAGLVTGYVRQQIALRVTALYFHCLALREMQTSLESQIASAEALAKQAKAYLEEGVATASQAHQAELLLQVRQAALQQNKRAQDGAVADLLSTMGLSPLSGLSLVADTPIEAPKEALEELVLQALLANPQLQMADRNVAIQQDAVRLAITRFLPNLVGFANRASTSNSFTAYPDMMATGMAGVLNLFHGFADVNAYRAAREQQKAAYEKREEACFSIMVGVIRAHLNWEDAQTTMALAKKALETAESRASEADQQWKEGVLNTSDRLQATADRDEAQTNVTNARFQEQVALATLRHVMGGAYLGKQAEAAKAASGEAKKKHETK